MSKEILTVLLDFDWSKLNFSPACQKLFVLTRFEEHSSNLEILRTALPQLSFQ